MTPTALIAEDEPLLALALQQELARAWPALRVLATVGDGASAVAQALAHRPDVLFFDIRMPGMGGLEAAAALAEDWPGPAAGGQPFPQLVFVTAYDQYALQAFEAQAVDYLLKPVQPDRLQRTVARLQQGFAARAHAGRAHGAINLEAELEATAARLHALLPVQPALPAAAQPRLAVIQASVGNAIHMVPVAEVLYLEAADKYLRVLTARREYLIRTPLKDLLPQLDADAFWQIHRSVVVRAEAVDTVLRDAEGRLLLTLRGRPDKLPVSRLYAQRFRAM
jgi:DNA-binding LytR/AlgR family response regulator